MKRPTLALVESPAQLLNVIEWAAHHGTAAQTRLMVLPPREATTRLQLAAMVELAKKAGLAATWFEPRRSSIAMLGAVWEMFPRLVKAERLVVGDPFSRLVQSVLALTEVSELVVVDDGTATMSFVNQLASGVQLTRWHLRTTGTGVAIDLLAEHTRERLTPGDGRAVELFTAMPVAVPEAMTNTPNRFAWTRETFGPPKVKDAVDMVGTSLVETGVVALAPYLAGVLAVTRDQRPGRYFAHRRESDEKLRTIASQTGMKIVRPDVPLEIAAARGPVGHTIVSFPSTVTHTLPLVLAGSGVTVAVCGIPSSWLAAQAPSGAGEFLDEVTRTARERLL